MEADLSGRETPIGSLTDDVPRGLVVVVADGVTLAPIHTVCEFDSVKPHGELTLGPSAIPGSPATSLDADADGEANLLLLVRSESLVRPPKALAVQRPRPPKTLERLAEFTDSQVWVSRLHVYKTREEVF